MTIRSSLLALLADGPRHGYQLKAEFEAATGHAWPLNIGQVYTTLGRLERDGLVEASVDAPERQRPYRVTPQGRAEVEDWFALPVDRDPPSRDELAVKLLMAVATTSGDPSEVIQVQRVATVSRLQRLTRLKADADAGDLGWLLTVEHLILAAEAEARWLDVCEAHLARADVGALRASMGAGVDGDDQGRQAASRAAPEHEVRP